MYTFTIDSAPHIIYDVMHIARDSCSKDFALLVLGVYCVITYCKTGCFRWHDNFALFEKNQTANSSSFTSLHLETTVEKSQLSVVEI